MGAKYNLIAIGKQDKISLDDLFKGLFESVFPFAEMQFGKLGFFSIIDANEVKSTGFSFQDMQTFPKKSISADFLYFFYTQEFGRGGVFSLSFEDDLWFACLSMKDRVNIYGKLVGLWYNLKKHRPIIILGGEELELDAETVEQVILSKKPPFEIPLCDLAIFLNDGFQKSFQWINSEKIDEETIMIKR